MKLIKRTDLQASVTQQLKNTLTETLSESQTDNKTAAASLYDKLTQTHSLSITPPLEKPEEFFPMQFLTLNSLNDFRYGSSIKPGNIILNMEKLIKSIPEIVSIGSDFPADNPISTICGALSLWNKLIDLATVEITKEQAFIIAALWKNCNAARKITLDDGFAATNTLLKQYGEPEMIYSKYNRAIDSLTQIRCINLSEGVINLIEYISKRYIDNI